VTGSKHARLFQPKSSLTLGLWAKTETYLSAGRGFHSNDGRAGLVDNGNGTTGFARPPLLVQSTGEELGIRTNIVPRLTAAITIFQIDFASELTNNADAGSGRPSRRRGIEITGQYRPFRWLELNANLTFSHARYRDEDRGSRHIEDAPGFIGSAGLLVGNFGRWFGPVVYRDLGAHPLAEDTSVRSTGYREVNANIGHKLNPGLRGTDGRL
jgi:hypothetical protein